MKQHNGEKGGGGERRAPSQLVNRRIKFNWQTAMSGKTGSKDLCQATFPLTSSPSRMRNVSLLQDRV